MQAECLLTARIPRPLARRLAPFCLFLAASTALAQPPTTYELKLVHIFEGAQTEHVFVVGESGFRSVESLKAFLATLPKGSEVRWAPGCVRFGNEPLLSSEADLAAFRAFLDKKGIKLTLVPSG